MVNKIVDVSKFWTVAQYKQNQICGNFNKTNRVSNERVFQRMQKDDY